LHYNGRYTINPSCSSARHLRYVGRWRAMPAAVRRSRSPPSPPPPPPPDSERHRCPPPRMPANRDGGRQAADRRPDLRPAETRRRPRRRRCRRLRRVAATGQAARASSSSRPTVKRRRPDAKSASPRRRPPGPRSANAFSPAGRCPSRPRRSISWPRTAGRAADTVAGRTGLRRRSSRPTWCPSRRWPVSVAPWSRVPDPVSNADGRQTVLSKCLGADYCGPRRLWRKPIAFPCEPRAAARNIVLRLVCKSCSFRVKEVRKCDI